jgi:hypothetical protein
MSRKKSIAELIASGTYRKDRHEARRIAELSASAKVEPPTREEMNDLGRHWILFCTGTDYLHELTGIADDYGKVPPPYARKAWARLGKYFMVQWRAKWSHNRAPWAVRKFGEPQ